jgi:hypothetical protein
VSAAAGAGASLGSVAFAVECGPCGLAGEPLLHLDQADQLAAVHDHLHHRGVPTAATRPLHANTDGNPLP